MDGFYAVIVFVVTWVAPSIFFLGILAQAIRRSRSTHDHAGVLPSEPFVLMALGAWFLVINGPLLQQFALAMEYRLGATGSEYFGEKGLAFFRIAFGLAAVSVMATLAKAFWTHVQLEEDSWGAVSPYRQAVWDKGPWPKWLEYIARCAIAVTIVLMQKQLGDMARVAHIHDIDAYQRGQAPAPTQSQEAQFLIQFSEWLGEFARLGVYLYVFIIIWLAIVANAHLSAAQSPHDKLLSTHKALWGTALSSVPAFLVVLLMHHLATGNYWPTPFVPIESGAPEPWSLVSAAGIFLLLAGVIVVNLFWTLFVGPLKEIWAGACRFGRWARILMRRGSGKASH